MITLQVILKMINKFFIIISFGSISIFTENLNDNNFNGHQWYLGISAVENNCRITPVKPRIFLIYTSCLYHLLCNYPSHQFWINLKLASNLPLVSIYASEINFDKKEIDEFFNETRLSSIIITKQLLMPFNIVGNFTQMTDIPLKDLIYLDKRLESDLNNNTQDIDFANCFVPLIGTNRTIQGGPCTKDKNFISCTYNYTKISRDSKRLTPGFELLCNSIKNPKIKFLAGLVHKKNKFYPNQNGKKLWAINVSDMWEFIENLWQKLDPIIFKT